MIQNDLGIVSHSDQKISELEEPIKMQEYIFKTSDDSLPLAGLLLMNFCINIPKPFFTEGAVQRRVKIFYFSEETIVISIV